MNGQGTCWWQDGTMYKGAWRNCIKEGEGTLTYADGSQYIGPFSEDFPNGKGKKVFPDGSVYTGEFKNGQFHGSGRYKQPVQQVEYDGMWCKNEMKGIGVKKLEGGALEIGGYFENGTVNGKGHKKWKNDDGTVG